VLYLALGLIGLPLGADLLVDSSIAIATVYGVSETVIGLTLVAVGTSLPELATTVMAAIRKHADVALGNVIGSNMFNLLGIIGIPRWWGRSRWSREFLRFDIWVMLAPRWCWRLSFSCGGPWAGSLVSCSRRSTSATSRCCCHGGRGMTALVTGAAKRLGRAMALGWRSAGTTWRCTTPAAPRRRRRPWPRSARWGAGGAVQADLTVEAEMQALLPRAAEALGGPITVLVNNASIFEYDNIETATRESWDRHLESNLRAPFVLSQAMAAQVPEAGADETGEPLAQGLIVNMIDQRVRKLTPEFMSYTIAKMGLWALTRTSAQALAPHVRVNAIGPGPTMQGARQSEEHFARQRAATVPGRGADPEGICAALGLFAAGAGRDGQLICVDGGQHLAGRRPTCWASSSPTEAPCRFSTWGLG
jgi:NAD(P)-dependent dehydrogenase (short-subunit alcohol dehydrogenase family)